MLKKRFFKTKDECEVAFELDLEDAKRVDLLCDSNGWEPIAMKKAKNGSFRARIRLPKEEGFQFRYLVDGNAWLNDDDADDYRYNEFGGRNCVIYTTADSRPPTA
jgi:1,4-alpha-glucan branching enzyme